MKLRAFLVTLLLMLVHADVRAQDVDGFMSRVAAAWLRGDAQAIAALGDPGGMSLEVEGTHVGEIPPRQAAAVLRRVFDDRETLKAVVGPARTMSGNKRRAYAEIVWERRSRGTTQPERVNVFVAVAQDGTGWRITEIRLIP